MPIAPLDLARFGRVVARHRNDLGWSIDRLAEHSGLSRKTIINVENAHKGLRLSTADAIARALDVPLTQLIEEAAQLSA